MIQELKAWKNNNNPDVDFKKQKETETKNLSRMHRELAQQIMDKIHGIDFESEEERQNFQTKIEYKIKAGAKLSQRELKYLRKYNPYMYHQMIRVQQKREALKERLKHCRTKEEAQQVIGDAFTTISDKDPAREAMVAAVQNVSRQFCSSDAYQKLPNTEEELRKAKKMQTATDNPFREDEETEKTDGGYETILYQFSNRGYQEAIVGDSAQSNVFAVNV